MWTQGKVMMQSGGDIDRAQAKLEIRTARPDDAAAIGALLDAAFADYLARLGGHPESSDPPERIARAIADESITAACLDGRIVGILWATVRDAVLYIERIAVDPALQGQGIGRRLLAEAEHLAAARGLDCLKLHTVEFMTPLVDLYRRHGFVIVDRARPAHGRDSFVRVYLEKRLSLS